jgi:ribosomal protein S12 methylthiotransferase
MPRKKIGILSLGCPRNLVDSEGILSRLKLKGYPIVDLEDADIGIINTCSFIKEAKQESIEAILDLIDLKAQGRLKKIIVYGCLSQRYKEELLPHFKEVDAFIGRVSLNHTRKSYSLTPEHYAYVKICEGCVNNCSFCVIPQIKGKFSSRGIDSVIEEVRRLDEQKVKEINIVGQDITLYGKDQYRSPKLAGLLRKILGHTRGINWIRLLYLYPSRISDDLLGLIKDEPRICKYIDLPIQHINNRILKLMNRDATKEEILRLIDKIRRRIPDVAIRTSLIVGFPTETDREFKELWEFVRSVQFDRLGAFIYSREEGTPAYSFKPQVSQRAAQERLQIIMSTQQEIARGLNEKYLGRVMDVLIDEKENDSYLGRTQYDAPEVDGIVFVKSAGPLCPGDLIKVKITDTLEYDLAGEAVNTGGDTLNRSG